MDVVAYKAIMNVDREKKAAERPAFRPLVYICSPFSGDIEENKKKAADFAHFAYKQGCIPVTAHLMFPFMNDESKEERALALRMDHPYGKMPGSVGSFRTNHRRYGCRNRQSYKTPPDNPLFQQ